MKSVLVTGAGGFIGRNLVARLETVAGVRVMTFHRSHTLPDLRERLKCADVIYHLAGVNRPASPDEFEQVNHGLTQRICDDLHDLDRQPTIVFASSYQATLENPYGISKRKAEDVLQSYAESTKAPVRIFRLTNVFGKWCRPNYNSVTATFCHNISHDLPITIADPDAVVNLVYIDDVVNAFLADLADDLSGFAYAEVEPKYPLKLGELARRIQALHDIRRTLTLPDLSDRLNVALYATYLSYIEADARSYALEQRSDMRGGLAELAKSPYFGQIFVSRTKPGVTRGNHYHHTKVEKFIVLEGTGLIRMRQISSGDIVEYGVSGTEFRIVDIPPGYTHSIANIGSQEMVVLFWASEIFDPDQADTHPLPVEASVDR